MNRDHIRYTGVFADFRAAVEAEFELRGVTDRLIMQKVIILLCNPNNKGFLFGVLHSSGILREYGLENEDQNVLVDELMNFYKDKLFPSLESLSPETLVEPSQKISEKAAQRIFAFTSLALVLLILVTIFQNNFETKVFGSSVETTPDAVETVESYNPPEGLRPTVNPLMMQLLYDSIYRFAHLSNSETTLTAENYSIPAIVRDLEFKTPLLTLRFEHEFSPISLFPGYSYKFALDELRRTLFGSDLDLLEGIVVGTKFINGKEVHYPIRTLTVVKPTSLSSIPLIRLSFTNISIPDQKSYLGLYAVSYWGTFNWRQKEDFMFYINPEEISVDNNTNNSQFQLIKYLND